MKLFENYEKLYENQLFYHKSNQWIFQEKKEISKGVQSKLP